MDKRILIDPYLLYDASGEFITVQYDRNSARLSASHRTKDVAAFEISKNRRAIFNSLLSHNEL